MNLTGDTPLAHKNLKLTGIQVEAQNYETDDSFHCFV